MKITETGVLHLGRAGTTNAIGTFPSVVVISDDLILATYRVGISKDGEDEVIHLRRSFDGGHKWEDAETPFSKARLDGRKGSLKICYLTLVESNHLIAAAMWVDRESHPGKPLFNPETEGCLPMSILIADSFDAGLTWTSWRVVPMLEDIGPASLTNPVIRFPDGALALSVETNKNYNDAGDWRQRVVYLYSHDQGQTWSEPHTVAEDESRRIFYWDQRAGVAPNGKLVTFSWTYERQTNRYLNIHRNLSLDQGGSWGKFEDLGFADQASHPAILPDGKIVIAWVDRFDSVSIRARLAMTIDSPFLPESEVVVYQHEAGESRSDSPGELLSQMSQWSFGLPFAEVLPNGEVLVCYYAGTDARMNIHWARLALS